MKGTICKRRREVVGDGDDIINTLPDRIFHQILSSIENTRYATCVLSKRWRYIWTTLQNLHFECIRQLTLADYDSNGYVLLRDPLDDNVIPIVEELQRRLPPVNAVCEGQVEDEENHGAKDDVESGEQEFLFEFQALEVALEGICSFLDARTR
ncbi:hypothetical protein RHGRI_002889 [Rhododendron griersonianum]|uniref:F-box domain-containing protein n=1 Tax=Rhododendron griersonianum TaxID=479676 RepID=A0AAV6LQR4_9ERIC|nr:hypothetical protein RHGRI_002889 [Rhododendron griersonianum]